MSKTIDIVLPQSEEASHATVIEWLKQVGDPVAEHEPVVEVATDKVTMEIASPATGVLHEILCAPDTDLEAGGLLGRVLLEIPEQVDSGGGTPTPVVDEEIDWTDRHPGEFEGHRLSPLVRRMLREHNLSPEDIQGTGREARITHRDVLQYVAEQEGSTRRYDDLRDTSDEPGASPDEADDRVSAPDDSADVYGRADEASSGGSRRVPHTPMRRAIASHMVDSMLRTAPHVTAIFDADLSAVLRHKRTNRQEAERRGVRLTLTCYFVRAAAAAVRAVPQINSRWHDDALEVFEAVDVGVATALGDEGLVVPVIRDVHRLNIWGVAAEMQALTDKARSGSLKQEDLRGGTLTITNHGVSGSLIATPIINQPQSAIIGVGRLEKRVHVVEVDERDTIQIAPMVYVSLTIDHRALDGYQANRYLTAFVDALQNWE